MEKKSLLKCPKCGGEVLRDISDGNGGVRVTTWVCKDCAEILGRRGYLLPAK